MAERGNHGVVLPLPRLIKQADSLTRTSNHLGYDMTQHSGHNARWTAASNVGEDLLRDGLPRGEAHQDLHALKSTVCCCFRLCVRPQLCRSACQTASAASQQRRQSIGEAAMSAAAAAAAADLPCMPAAGLVAHGRHQHLPGAPACRDRQQCQGRCCQQAAEAVSL